MHITFYMYKTKASVDCFSNLNASVYVQLSIIVSGCLWRNGEFGTNEPERVPDFTDMHYLNMLYPEVLTGPTCGLIFYEYNYLLSYLYILIRFQSLVINIYM